jgi:hypothetical protein
MGAAQFLHFATPEARKSTILSFCHRPGPWTCGRWKSDADFLWSSEGGSEQHNLTLFNGSYADAGGRQVRSGDSPIRYAEVSSSGKRVDQFSSDPGNRLHLPLQSVLGVEEAMVQGTYPKGIGL